MMKNIQLIDGADNCTYEIYSVDEEIFNMIFPDQQDIEFVSDLSQRFQGSDLSFILKNVWAIKCDKKKVNGIHGTLFFELDFKKQFYPTKKESEMIVVL